VYVGVTTSPDSCWPFDAIDNFSPHDPFHASGAVLKYTAELSNAFGVPDDGEIRAFKAALKAQQRDETAKQRQLSTVKLPKPLDQPAVASSVDSS